MNLDDFIIKQKKEDLRQIQIGFALFEVFCQPNYLSDYEIMGDHENLFSNFHKRHETHAKEYWKWFHEEGKLRRELEQMGIFVPFL